MNAWTRRVLPAVAALLCLLSAAGASLGSADEGGSPALTAIDAAHARGEISDGQAMLYKLYFIKGSAALPKAYDLGGDRIKCGTPIVMEAQEKMDSYSEPYKGQIMEMMTRPTLNAFEDTPHFRVHYSTSGANIIYQWPNPAYKDSVKASCEYCYNYYVAHGWQVPPSDGANGGGNGLIDCYVDQLSGVYGVTYSESPGPNWPNDYTAYFIIDNDYTGFGYADRTLPMKVTVAHEYHHVVQMGYTVANNWWMENLATYNEDQCYDTINDNYNYLGLFLSYPYNKQATFNGGFEYGAFLWPRFLMERWNEYLNRDIQLCTAGGTNIYTCFNNVLGGQGTNHEDALKEWCVWNFYTQVRNDGQHYEEGGAYNRLMSYDKIFTSYPTGDQHPTTSPERRPEATACSVQRFTRNTQSPDNLLTVHFNGPNCASQVVVIAKETGQVVFHEYYMTLDANGDGSVDIPQWDQREYAYMMASFPADCGNGRFDYIFSAETTTSGAVDNPPLYARTVDLRQNTPNPFGPETSISYRLGENSSVTLGIFDASGRQVRTLIHGEQNAGEYAVRWDGRDDQGLSVPRGVYFYRLNTGEQTQMRKMILAE